MGVSEVHRHFKLASYFILAAVSVGILKVISVFWNADFADTAVYLRLALNALILILFLWLAVNISKGKNWARITFVVFGACMLILAPYSILLELKTSSTSAIYSTLFVLFLIISILLLYSKGARQWYSDQLGQN